MKLNKKFGKLGFQEFKEVKLATLKNMINKFLVFLIISFQCSFISASISEINNLSLFKKTVYSLNENDMVLLDIDFTVMKPCDAALLPCGWHLRKQYLHTLDLKRRELLQSIIALEGKEELVDVA